MRFLLSKLRIFLFFPIPYLSQPPKEFQLNFNRVLFYQFLFQVIKLTGIIDIIPVRITQPFDFLPQRVHLLQAVILIMLQK